MQTVIDSIMESDMGDFVLPWSLGRKDVLQFRQQIETLKRFICKVIEQLGKVSYHVQK